MGGSMRRAAMPAWSLLVLVVAGAAMFVANLRPHKQVDADS